MAENGRLPKSSLRRVAGKGHLIPAAATAWNAMAAHIYRETGVKIAPNGPDSTYRPYDRQVYWRNYWCSRGACGNAAVPGTSNHGWGLAVDTDDSYYVNRYGDRFGWQKAWSDAPSEPWHFRYATGHYDGPDPGPKYGKKPRPKWFRRLGNRIEQARKRRASKKRRREHAKSKDRRALLHRAIGRLQHSIDQWIQRRKAWLRRNR